MAIQGNFATAITDLVDSLTAAEKLNISELLFTKAFGVNSLQDQHTVMTGVRNGNLIPIITTQANYESFPFNDQTDCSKPTCDVNETYSTFKWNLGLIECRVPICMRSFEEDFLKFWNEYKQVTNDPDLNTALLQRIIDVFTMNMRAAMWRVVYFGDTASSSNLFDGFDGFFVQAGANPSQVIDITENSGGTFAAQKMTGEEVYNLLISMYDQAASEVWFDPARLEYRITRQMAASLVSFLNGLTDRSPYNCECLVAGQITSARTFMLEGLRVNGIPVLVHQEWDGVINGTSELNGGGGTNPRVDPNRAFLTYRDNLLIGTSNTESLEYFDIFYDKLTNKIYLDGGAYIGAGIPLIDEYIVAGVASNS